MLGLMGNDGPKTKGDDDKRDGDGGDSADDQTATHPSSDESRTGREDDGDPE